MKTENGYSGSSDASLHPQNAVHVEHALITYKTVFWDLHEVAFTK